MLDGYFARRLNQATPTGAVVDGVLDKLFAAVVVGALLAQGQRSAFAALLLATRELGGASCGSSPDGKRPPPRSFTIINEARTWA
jgi:phosphatidylglycerophosphate synthase